jgi:transcriptional regulator with XRE-family HTH domain
MSKKTFGSVLRDKRQSLDLTQRDLADLLGVKAAHVAFLESGRRKPSLTLLRRISEICRIDPQKLFLLAHPEAKFLIKLADTAQPKASDSIWKSFTTNSALLAKERVTPEELKVLEQVSMLNPISSERQFLFVLNAIRLAVEEEDL